ncbi:TonB-dependent receptor [Nitrobacter hamburgensis X14]|uniref:TonB-dependent receptor n=1 Tax=Nitrobacter hamburgensis (strain DSM 10229 / NCIMB 13809 / X14) TaxID=323097 RepID=Q1QN62_NITHX|nr:TonB-dependent receptor [Nitrobacter hamburgensis]ABE62335.1 TonB-dependent receptor [Nitrobacter hamburgensis X14]
MSNARMPRSLRTIAVADSIGKPSLEISSVGKVSTVAGLIAVASFSAAEAQQSNLPPVTIDAPVVRPHHARSKPTADHVRARTALRRAARRAQPAQVAPVPFPNAGNLAADRNPYADAAAPYKVDHLQASGKFPEPLLNTPKTVTVLSKDVLADKGATLLKDVARTTAGVTLGTGEGGNAFGDRFFIRGFDARNDVFIDGVRDPGVSVRENFFTEQVEILRGPGSSFAGRGTTGGAINIVTKQATTEGNFYNMDTMFGTDQTKRVVLDVNQVISPTLAVRAGGLFQDANVAGRNYITDDRGGGFLAVTWKPVDAIKVQANYIHTDLHGLPDFGVPYFRPNSALVGGFYNSTAGGPFPQFGLNRNTWYGFLNRDFQSYRQDIGTLNLEAHITPDLMVTNKTRVQHSILSYIGTLPERPVVTDPNPANWTLSANPQSRFQPTNVFANQTEATYKFGTGPWRHTALAGVEISAERSSIDKYSGLSSEQLPGGLSGTGSVPGVNIFNPQFTNASFPEPSLAGLPTKINIDTKSVYLLDTANYNDFIILNGGIRYDDYHVNTSGYGTVNGVSNVFGTQSLDSGLTNYNLGAVVKPLPNVSLYAAYATSSNPVGAEFDGTSAQYGGLAPILNGNSSQIFGPEKNRAAEVGTKWELFDRHLLLQASLFQTWKDNARESQNIANGGAATPTCPYPAGSSGTVSCITAGAAYWIRGIDIEAAGKITDKWSVFGGIVLMQSEVTKSLVPSAQPLLYASNVGLPLANIAHQSFNVLTKYQLTDVWEIGGQATYRSQIYGGTFLAANQGTSLPDYWRFDAFVEAKVNKNWQVKLAVNNITNKLYYDALYQSATPFVFVAPGRVAYLTLSARY